MSSFRLLVSYVIAASVLFWFIESSFAAPLARIGVHFVDPNTLRPTIKKLPNESQLTRPPPTPAYRKNFIVTKKHQNPRLNISTPPRPVRPIDLLLFQQLDHQPKIGFNGINLILDDSRLKIPVTETPVPTITPPSIPFNQWLANKNSLQSSLVNSSKDGALIPNESVESGEKHPLFNLNDNQQSLNDDIDDQGIFDKIIGPHFDETTDNLLQWLMLIHPVTQPLTPVTEPIHLTDEIDDESAASHPDDHSGSVAADSEEFNSTDDVEDLSEDEYDYFYDESIANESGLMDLTPTESTIYYPPTDLDQVTTNSSATKLSTGEVSLLDASSSISSQDSLEEFYDYTDTTEEQPEVDQPEEIEEEPLIVEYHGSKPFEYQMGNHDIETVTNSTKSQDNPIDLTFQMGNIPGNVFVTTAIPHQLDIYSVTPKPIGPPFMMNFNQTVTWSTIMNHQHLNNQMVNSNGNDGILGTSSEWPPYSPSSMNYGSGQMYGNRPTPAPGQIHLSNNIEYQMGNVLIQPSVNNQLQPSVGSTTSTSPLRPMYMTPNQMGGGYFNYPTTTANLTTTTASYPAYSTTTHPPTLLPTKPLTISNNQPAATTTTTRPLQVPAVGTFIISSPSSSSSSSSSDSGSTSFAGIGSDVTSTSSGTGIFLFFYFIGLPILLGVLTFLNLPLVVLGLLVAIAVPVGLFLILGVTGLLARKRSHSSNGKLGHWQFNWDRFSIDELRRVEQEILTLLEHFPYRQDER